jgi:predicted permease
MAIGKRRVITSNDSVNPNINQRTNMKGPLLVLFVIVIILLAIWDGVWKLIALWKSARHDQLAWFICLAIFNTVGVLPILYILFFQKTGTQCPAPLSKT